MNKELIKEFQLRAGGSHYPSINPDMQEIFAKQIINECIDAVATTDTRHAGTSYDRAMALATLERAVAAIKERFML